MRAVEIEGTTKARPTIVRMHEVPLPDGAAKNGEVVETHTVASALKKLWTVGGFKSKDVVLGMGNQRVIARDLVMPKASLAQIREALPFQVQDMLPMPVSEALLDFYPISESDAESGPMVNGLLVAAVKQSVLAKVDAAILAGLRPLEVDLIPFALSRLQARSHGGPETIALVDVGSSTTSVIILIAGVPQFVRIIPAGGNDVTLAVSMSLEIEEGLAENAKRALGLTPASILNEHRPILEHIHRSTAELLNSIRNTLSYFDNTHPVGNVERIVLSGGGSRLGGFPAALQELTRVELVQSDPFATLTVAKSVGTQPMEIRDSMSVALGLALGAAA
ncbi:type IV pilus assembly protein PilM [Conyzicola lurida]|uniref:Type IV pilus assembly protein PilM n=1 Tax=Conyzicola lurida TaxID=1172621 RepID=A0A841AHI4_9MICO|nr:type IV pilus assembly protein PilM [Conyzicola lurida]